MNLSMIRAGDSCPGSGLIPGILGPHFTCAICQKRNMKRCMPASSRFWRVTKSWWEICATRAIRRNSADNFVHTLPRWNEKAGPRRDAISSQWYALEVQKETGHEKEYHWEPESEASPQSEPRADHDRHGPGRQDQPVL